MVSFARGAGPAALVAVGLLGTGAAGVVQASPPPPNPNETGQVVYLVNNSSGALVFDEVQRFYNVVGKSGVIAPGETGYVKSTSPTDGASFTAVIGDIYAPTESVYITTTLDENGQWQTTCRPNAGLVCTVSPERQGNWPRSVTIEDFRQ